MKSKTIFLMETLTIIVLLVLLTIQWTNREECYDKERKAHNNANNCVFGKRALEIIRYLFVKNVVGKEIVRIGHYADGGYSMLDDFSKISLAYGIGVGGEWSWDLDLASRGINVFMFDPTIEKPDLQDPRLKFYNIGIATSKSSKKNYMPLDELLILDDNLDKKNMILKMDVEGAEWEVFHELPSSTLEKFSQIVVEFHYLDKILTSSEDYNVGLSVFEKLNKTHQLIWLHGNNLHQLQIFGGVPVPVVFEAVYVKREENLKFTNKLRRERRDVRQMKDRSETFLWWLEAEENVDVSDVFFFYKNDKK